MFKAVLWIRIRIGIHLAVLDPVPYWECGSWSGSRRTEIDQNLQLDLVSCLSKRLLYLRRHVFLTYYLLLVSLFSCKNSTFCYWLGSGFSWTALVCCPRSGSALRWKAGSGSALKPMLIHNTGFKPRSVVYAVLIGLVASCHSFLFYFILSEHTYTILHYSRTTFWLLMFEQWRNWKASETFDRIWIRVLKNLPICRIRVRN